jgi:hypothetical protein
MLIVTNILTDITDYIKLGNIFMYLLLRWCQGITQSHLQHCNDFFFLWVYLFHSLPMERQWPQMLRHHLLCNVSSNASGYWGASYVWWYCYNMTWKCQTHRWPREHWRVTRTIGTLRWLVMSLWSEGRTGPEREGARIWEWNRSGKEA